MMAHHMKTWRLGACTVTEKPLEALNDFQKDQKVNLEIRDQTHNGVEHKVAFIEVYEAEHKAFGLLKPT